MSNMKYVLFLNDTEGKTASLRALDLALENYRHWPLKSRFSVLKEWLK